MKEKMVWYVVIIQKCGITIQMMTTTDIIKKNVAAAKSARKNRMVIGTVTIRHVILIVMACSTIIEGTKDVHTIAIIMKIMIVKKKILTVLTTIEEGVVFADYLEFVDN